MACIKGTLQNDKGEVLCTLSFQAKVLGTADNQMGLKKRNSMDGKEVFRGMKNGKHFRIDLREGYFHKR